MLPPKHCNINLTGPIPRWDEAIPLGNGILGSLFWGPMEHLRISVDIAGLWLRRRPEEKLDKEFTYAKLVELARKGDVAETRRIFDTPYARPTPTKIPRDTCSWMDCRRAAIRQALIWARRWHSFRKRVQPFCAHSSVWGGLLGY